MINFDEIIERGEASNSFSSKWQGFSGRFNGYDVNGALPMWVADMDFRCPQQVVDGVISRAQHGIYGYVSDDAVDAFKVAAKEWYARRWGWKTHEKWMIYVPAVVPAICAAVQAFTNSGEGVIVQSPVYDPFYNSIRNNGRNIVNQPLLEKNGIYRMNFSALEQVAQEPNNRMLLLCSPHNPVGRVWQEEELRKVLKICAKNNVLVFSDEIHGDLIMKGHKQIPLGTIAEEYNVDYLVACSPSKTFNIAGLQAALVISPNREVLRKMKKQIVANRLPYNNIFGPLAGEIAYRYCDEYVDTLCSYIKDNYDYLTSFCNAYLPNIRVTLLEGTYLAWLDFRKFSFTSDKLYSLIFEKAKVVVEPGEWFGDGGEGFLRLNLGCPRKRLEEALNRILVALKDA